MKEQRYLSSLAQVLFMFFHRVGRKIFFSYFDNMQNHFFASYPGGQNNLYDQPFSPFPETISAFIIILISL
jgi:hypothetical protein